MMKKDALALLLAGSPYIQILFEVVEGGGLVGVIATKAAHRSGLVLVADVAGRSVDEIVPPGTVASLRSGFHDALQQSEAVTYEEFAQLGEREVWGMTTLTPLIDERGVPAHVLMSFLVLDFVERTESALERTEAGLRHLIEASSDAILVTASDRIIHANQVATVRYGVVLDQPLTAILPNGVASKRATVNGTNVEIVAITLSERESFLLVLKPS
jgi:hypothetical protein